MEEKSINPIGIYGWRKRCLYCLVLLLLLVIVLNICLTVWIIVVLKFNIEGMGGVRITSDGLQVQDSAEFLDTVYLESIKADDELQIRSQTSISLDANGKSKLTVDSDAVIVQSNQFRVELNSDITTSDSASETALLSTTSNGSLELRTGSIYLNGSVFDKRITTKELYSGGEGLLVEGNMFELNATDSIILNSDEGSIDLVAAGNLTLSTGSNDNSQVIFAADSIILKGIPSGQPTAPSISNPVTFNLCVCPNGKLYRVQAADDDTINGCTIDEELCNN